MTFTQMLAAAWQKNNSLLCVGLDPDPAKFPAHLKGRDDAILEFCAAIVDATAGHHAYHHHAGQAHQGHARPPPRRAHPADEDGHRIHAAAGARRTAGL